MDFQHPRMEVSFKYSMITTDIRPNKRLIEEISSATSSDHTKNDEVNPQQQPQHDGNPRPLKRRKGESLVEEVGCEPECDISEEDDRTTEELERTIKGLDEVLGSCEELGNKAALIERKLVSYQQGHHVPIVDIIKFQLNLLASKLQEQKSFCSLWVVCILFYLGLFLNLFFVLYFVYLSVFTR